MSRSYSGGYRGTTIVPAPIFIPYGGGGGGGAGGGGVDPIGTFYLCSIAVVCGALIVAYRSSEIPRIQMKIVRNSGNAEYLIKIRRINYWTHMKYVSYNTDTLKAKGYLVNDVPKPIYCDYYDWTSIASVHTKESFETLHSDCKSGDVHSIFLYTYNSFPRGREITKKQKLYWHKQKLQEELK